MLQKFKEMVKSAVGCKKVLASKDDGIVLTEAGYVYTTDVEWMYRLLIKRDTKSVSIFFESSKDRKSSWHFGNIDTTQHYENIIKSVLERFTKQHYIRFIMMSVREVRNFAKVKRNNKRTVKVISGPALKRNKYLEIISSQKAALKPVVETLVELADPYIQLSVTDIMDKFIAWTNENRGFSKNAKQHWGQFAIDSVVNGIKIYTDMLDDESSTQDPYMRKSFGLGNVNPFHSIEPFVESFTTYFPNLDIPNTKVTPDMFIRYTTVLEMIQHSSIYKEIADRATNNEGRVNVAKYTYGCLAIIKFLLIVTGKQYTDAVTKSYKYRFDYANAGYMSPPDVVLIDKYITFNKTVTGQHTTDMDKVLSTLFDIKPDIVSWQEWNFIVNLKYVYINACTIKPLEINDDVVVPTIDDVVPTPTLTDSVWSALDSLNLK